MLVLGSLLRVPGYAATAWTVVSVVSLLNDAPLDGTTRRPAATRCGRVAVLTRVTDRLDAGGRRRVRMIVIDMACVNHLLLLVLSIETKAHTSKLERALILGAWALQPKALGFACVDSILYRQHKQSL